MRTIERDELKAKLDRNENIKLCCTLSEIQFNAMHITGSIHVDSPDVAMKHFNFDDEIIVYCSDITCSSSQLAYRLLIENGYKNVRRYEGGLADWQAAGYPLEGTMVN
jgi:rhodanese-related sulfurtransferase